MTRPVERDDLFRVRWVGEPAVDADGRVAFVVARLDRAADRLLHEVHVTEPDGTSRRIGPIEADERAPQWSPDGRRLAILSDRDGERRVWIIDPGDGSAHPAAAAPGPIIEFAWSPDGTRLAAAVARLAASAPTDRPYRVDGARTFADARGPVVGPDRREIWILAADEDTATCLTDPGEGSDWGPTWSPDGRSIACCSDGGLDPEMTSATSLWVVAASDGSARRRVVDAAGPIKVARWAPDGTAIAFLGHRHGDAQGENTELWLVAAGGAEPGGEPSAPRCLSLDLDRSVGMAVRGEDERGFGTPDLAWTPDGGRILAIVADGGTSSLRWFDRDGASGTLIAGDLAPGSTRDAATERCVLQFAVAGRSGDIVAAISDPTTPGELWRTGPDGTGERRLTSINDAWLAELDLAPTRHIRASSTGGVEIDGWLTAGGTAATTGTTDADPRPGPLVLQVHGGPHYPVGARFQLEAQAFAARGYRFLIANPRGSQGYGPAFATGIRTRWGGPDFDDLTAVVDHVVDLGLADPGRVAIIGESYGGFMAAWAIGRTDRFAAAIAENPITDLRTVTSQGGGPTFWDSEMGGPPWAEPARYAAQSPITHVERMTTPLLLIHAELDGNCPIAQSEVLHAALRALDRDVTFVRIPGEGHLVNLFGRPSRRRARQSIIDDFLTRHLGG